ncbi:MAG: hypothetical protein ACREM3_01410 [Candidatus Rokuibacteriota bacterium]
MVDPTLPEIAFYYPNPMWHYGDWIKNLVLFFDGVGLLVPEYMKERPEQTDPAIVAGLKQHGLLHIIEPERVVDRSATEKLAVAMTDVLVSGVLDPLAAEKTTFHELSYSRLGGVGDPGLAKMILDELKARGVARDSEDGKSIPMHPMVRALVLVLLAQILRPAGEKLGVELSPTTDQPKLVQALVELLSLPDRPSAGHVVAFDVNTVGVDVSAVPIDELLDYRNQHRAQYRGYIRSVRDFVRQLGPLTPAERAQAFDDRQAEIDDLAADLRRRSRRAWGQPASFALSIAGATWTAVSGDPLGALLAGGAALAGLASGGTTDAHAYSYLFSARQDLLW